VSISLFGTNVIWVILGWFSRILVWKLFISSISRSLVFIIKTAFLNNWCQALLSLTYLTDEHGRSWSKILFLFLFRDCHYILRPCKVRILYWTCKCILRIRCLQLWSILLFIRILKIHALFAWCILLCLDWLRCFSEETSALVLYF
jgi:hypothetical protein